LFYLPRFVGLSSVSLNVTPDFCQVGDNIIPFDISRTLDNECRYVDSVFAWGEKVLAVDSVIDGVDGDAGSGIHSGTSLKSGDCEVISGSPTVRAEGKCIARHLDLVWMNNHNTIGRLCTIPTVAAPMTCSKSEAEVPREPSGYIRAWEPTIGDRLDKLMSDWRQGKLGDGMFPEASRVVKEKLAGWKESLTTAWDALPFTADEATTAAARQRIADGAMGTLEGLATLMGPSLELEQAAIGNPELTLIVEEMRAKQAVARGGDAQGDGQNSRHCEAGQNTGGSGSQT
jgi:hypothetical protein